ncbi:hypothetical protein BX265_2317 [Streptomyces sp. TLI_235]|nr:hypothetical protein [Streptomyces sp. TLI_235]PBC77566.1 hypothetical protein BX265_2317 [Streptomyces sp. TLI_235]
MSATLSPTVSVLVSAAALHVFLAQHPEAAELPIEWSFRARDGITGYMPAGTPDVAQAADLIAGLLGAEVAGNEHTSKDGSRTLFRYFTTGLNGVPFFFSGHAAVGGA